MSLIAINDLVAVVIAVIAANDNIVSFDVDPGVGIVVTRYCGAVEFVTLNKSATGAFFDVDMFGSHVGQVVVNDLIIIAAIRLAIRVSAPIRLSTSNVNSFTITGVFQSGLPDSAVSEGVV